MICDICHQDAAFILGEYQPYLDYQTSVFECSSCHSRFTEYDSSVYERLHATVRSSYHHHEDLAERTKVHFADGDHNGIYDVLGRSGKYSFVIETIRNEADCFRLLEIGCSKGYLTSWFLSQSEYQVLGVDGSESAVSAAKTHFGDFFVVPDSPRIRDSSPYDAIYHTGTVGCVESPIELTHRLLELLRPGGILVFNAPNVDDARATGELWSPITAPPDLRVLFHTDIWENMFSDVADVSVKVDAVNDATRFRLGLQRVLRVPRLPRPSLNLFGQNHGREVESAARCSRAKWLNRIERCHSWLARFLLTRAATRVLTKTLLRIGPFPKPESGWSMQVVLRKKS